MAREASACQKRRLPTPVERRSNNWPKSCQRLGASGRGAEISGQSQRGVGRNRTPTGQHFAQASLRDVQGFGQSVGREFQGNEVVLIQNSSRMDGRATVTASGLVWYALRRHQRLHPVKFSAKVILGLREFLGGLPAQKIAIRQTEQTAQAQVGFGADASLAEQDLIEPRQRDASGLGHRRLGQAERFHEFVTQEGGHRGVGKFGHGWFLQW